MSNTLTIPNSMLDKMANANISGDSIQITNYAVTDSTVDDELTVGNIVHTDVITDAQDDTNNINTILVKVVIPSSVNSNNTVTKIYLYDADGDVFGYGLVPPFTLSQDNNIEAELSMYITNSNIDTVNLVAPSMSFVTRSDIADINNAGLVKLEDSSDIDEDEDNEVATPKVVKVMIDDNALDKATTTQAIAGTDDTKYMSAKTTKEAIEAKKYLKANDSGSVSTEEVVYSNKLTIYNGSDRVSLGYDREIGNRLINYYPYSGMCSEISSFGDEILRSGSFIRPNYIDEFNGSVVSEGDKITYDSVDQGGALGSPTIYAKKILDFLHGNGANDARNVQEGYGIKITSGTGTTLVNPALAGQYRSIVFRTGTRNTSQAELGGQKISFWLIVESGTVSFGEGTVLTPASDPYFAENINLRTVYSDANAVFHIFYPCLRFDTINMVGKDYAKYPVINPADLQSYDADSGITYFDNNIPYKIFAPTLANTASNADYVVDLTDIGTELTAATYHNADLSDKKSVIYKLQCIVRNYSPFMSSKISLKEISNNGVVGVNVNYMTGSDSVIIEAPVSSTTHKFRYEFSSSGTLSDTQAALSIIGYRD